MFQLQVDVVEKFLSLVPTYSTMKYWTTIGYQIVRGHETSNQNALFS